MKKRSKLFPLLTILAGIILLLSMSCYLNSGRSTETVPATISARNLPSTLTSISLTISGEGMDTITETIDPSETSFSIELPAGTDRLFELEILPATDSVFLKFDGSATADLVAGETTDVDISMEVTDMRLVFPDVDNFTSGPRIIQIDDITGANWLELKGTDLGLASDFEFLPYDIDYDNEGRIYVANSYTGAGIPPLFRLDSFLDTTPEVIVTDGESAGLTCIAIDRENNYIYYSTGSSPITRRSLGPPLGAEETFDILVEPAVSNFSTNGFSVDSAGVLYITNDMENTVFKYDQTQPVMSRVTATYSTGISSPWDSQIFGSNIIVSNSFGADGSRIVVLDTDLNYVTGFGNAPTGPDPITPITDDFFGPEMFVGILSKKITVIDEGAPNMEAYDYLVQIDDINGSNWTTYGTTGTGTGQFYFFSQH